MRVVPLLAHAGEGATWQALLVVAALAMIGVVVLAVVGRVRLDQADDLVLPLAGVAIVSSVAPLASAILSDWVGWAFPAGVVALVAVLLAALTPLELTPSSPLTYGALALAVVTGALLHQPLTVAWHPPNEFLPLADDVEVDIEVPEDGASVDAGRLEAVVTVTGGSVQNQLLPEDQLPTDPEEAGTLAVALDGEVLEVGFTQACTLATPCTEVAFPIEVTPGEHVLVVEFRRGDGVPMTPLITDRVEFQAR